ncbi:PAS domain S-box protein [Paracoccus sp. (in: a-proteobacteria)]|uniref:PAS domain S-box protein n=1 Tax=Paracoccus sp. TaxID=267 RepID=UPI003A849D5B
MNNGHDTGTHSEAAQTDGAGLTQALRRSEVRFRALAALSGKCDTLAAITAFLLAIRDTLQADDAIYLQDQADEITVAASARPELTGRQLAISSRNLHHEAHLTGADALLGKALGAPRSILVVPMNLLDCPQGALLVSSARSGHFANDLPLLRQLADLATRHTHSVHDSCRAAFVGTHLGGLLRATGATQVLDCNSATVRQAYGRLTDMQGQLVDILDALLTTGLEDVDAAIDRTLARMGHLTSADRVYVFTVRSGNDFIDNTHEWCAPGIEPVKDMLQGIPVTVLKEWGWLDRFLAREGVIIRDIFSLPDSCPASLPLKRQGTRSLLVVPIMQGDRFQGFIGYDSVRQSRDFEPGEFYLIQSVAKVMDWVLARHENNRRLQEAHDDTLAQSKRLKAVLAAIPDLALEVCPEGRFVTWHSDIARVPPALASVEKGRRLAETLPPDIWAVCRDAMDQLATKGSFACVTIALGADPEKHWYELSASRIGSSGYLFVLHDVTAAHHQNAEIELLSEVARRTTNIVAVTDPQRRVQWVNQAFTDITGWTLDEVRGRTPESFLRTEEVDPETSDLITNTVSAGRHIKTEVLNYTRDGRKFWSDLDVQPLFDTTGQMRGLVAVANDVTAFRQQAEALQKAARQAAAARAALEAAVNALQDGFVLFDAEDRLVVCNARYRELFPCSAELMEPGVTFETLLRHCVAAGEYPEALGHEDEWVAERLALHRQSYSEFEQQYPNGTWLRVFEKATSDGGHVGLRVDITKLKQAEIRAQSDLETAMEASLDGISFTDAEGNFQYMNRSHLDMFGFHSDEQVIGQPWTILYDPETIAWMQTNTMPKLSARGHWSGEVVGVAQDGTQVDQDVSLTMKQDGGILCVTRDMRIRRSEEAERDRLREDLQMARRREVISQMAAGLAHDFSNLLTTISGNATLIEQSAAPGSLTEIGAQRVQAASDQAVVLVRRLLTLGAHRSAPVLVDLCDPVRQASDLLRVSLRAPTRVRLELAATRLEAMADPTDVLQVLLNLAINANDALSGRPGEIRISVHAATEQELAGSFALGRIDPRRGYHAIVVSDDGCGMPADVAARVFEPYFTTKGSGGTGLGMSVVSSVVRSNRAALRLESTEGQGTRITVLWPAGRPPVSEPASTPDLTGLQGRLDGKLVLLVDDQPDVLDVLARILEGAGAEVASADHPQDVLSSVEEHPEIWDVLITDHDMPDINGTQLASRVRALAPNLPILLISSVVGSTDLSGSTFDAFVGKPVDPDVLVKNVEALVRTKEKTRRP